MQEILITIAAQAVAAALIALVTALANRFAHRYIVVTASAA